MLLKTSNVIINAAKAGLQVVSKSQLKKAPELIVAADANAVPPAGIEGVGVNDIGIELDFTPKKAVSIGALKIGHIKNRDTLISTIAATLAGAIAYLGQL